MITIKDLLLKGAAILNNTKIDSSRLDSELLLGFLLQKNREQLLMENNSEVEDSTVKGFMSLVERRATGYPLSYLTGRRSFFGIDFVVRPGVLIPRPETEHLVEEALQWLVLQNKEQSTVLDLGCGSGCIGLSILMNSLGSKLVAIDQSPVACEVTQLNAKQLGLESRVQVEQLSIAAHTQPICMADIIVANPPYIALSDDKIEEAVRKFEPHEALYSGETGFEKILQWKAFAEKSLQPGGLLLMEFGMGQGPKTKELFESDPAFECVRIGKDLSGLERFVVATRQKN